MASVKWLHRIDAIAGHFDGYQMERTYRYSHGPDDPGDPVTHIRVRSLMIPPGIPDFMTRAAWVDAGEILITGRAWAGPAAVARVEFSPDDGATWTDAQLLPPVGPWAWREWQCPWTAQPGPHTLIVRATDDRGNTQPRNPALDPTGNGQQYGPARPCPRRVGNRNRQQPAPARSRHRVSRHPGTPATPDHRTPQEAGLTSFRENDN